LYNFCKPATAALALIKKATCKDRLPVQDKIKRLVLHAKNIKNKENSKITMLK